MKTEYVTLLTVTASLLSGWGGAFIAGYFSRKASTDTLDKEYHIALQKTQEKEKTELIKLYISIIKIDFEKNVVDHYPNGIMELNEEIYVKEVRPKVYNLYHLVHDTVIKHFDDIEKTNSRLANIDWYFDQSDLQSDVYNAANSYTKMINEIRTIIDLNRQKV